MGNVIVLVILAASAVGCEVYLRRMSSQSRHRRFAKR